MILCNLPYKAINLHKYYKLLHKNLVLYLICITNSSEILVSYNRSEIIEQLTVNAFSASKDIIINK